MKVTDLQYGLEKRLVSKLDIVIKRCTNKNVRKDALIIIEGSEGEGKTNTSEAIAYYFKFVTGRPINMFFRLEPLIDFAKSTEEQIIIWDEPALDALSVDWYREANKNLLRLLMTCRKKRHILLFNFVKFYKFSEYVSVDRALFMVHMYTRREEEPGRFIYIPKRKLQLLYNDYHKSKLRNYAKHMAFGGSFPIVEKYLDKMGITVSGFKNATLADYERLKDEAIESIRNTNKKPMDDHYEIKFKTGCKKAYSAPLPITNKDELANAFGLSRRTLYKYSKIDLLAKENKLGTGLRDKYLIMGAEEND